MTFDIVSALWSLPSLGNPTGPDPGLERLQVRWHLCVQRDHHVRLGSGSQLRLERRANCFLHHHCCVHHLLQHWHTEPGLCTQDH